MVELFEETVRLVHVVGGFTGLAAFWVPVFTKKGSPVHRRFGRIFLWCAWLVLGSAEDLTGTFEGRMARENSYCRIFRKSATHHTTQGDR